MENKEIHGKMLETLKLIDKICKKEGISYMLAQGTLLGAVREQGFIEWDIEDADIMMHRKDFTVLEQYCILHADELGFLFDTDEIGLVPRMVSKGYPEIFVEVILIDHLPKNKLTRTLNQMKLRLLYGLLSKRSFDFKYTTKDRLKDLIKWLLNNFYDKTTKQKLYKKISQAGNRKQSDLVFFSNEIPRRMFVEFRKEILEETISVPFEDTELKVPKEWDAVLKFYYGDDYMKPKRNDYYAS